MSRYAFLIPFLLSCLQLSAQDSSYAKVYIIRTTSLNGFAEPFDVSIDKTILCKLENERFCVYKLAEGEHVFDVKESDNQTPHESNPVKINLVKGQTYYMELNFGSGAISRLQYEQISKAAADQLFRNCLKKPQCKN